MTAITTTTPAKRTALLTLLGLSGVFLVSFIWRPPDTPVFNLCLFRGLTGQPCPGCGMTRALCALSHGELWRALRFNPLSPLVYLFFLVSWLKSLATVSEAGPLLRLTSRIKLTKPFPQIALSLIAAWWLFRLATGWNE